MASGRAIEGECEWFLDCHDESMAIVEHSTLGEVQICGRHVDWLFEEHGVGSPVNPTKLMPPLAGRHVAKLRQIFADVDNDNEGE